MTYDASRNVIVLFGGTGGPGSFLGDTWERSGTTWTQRTPAVSPPARNAPMLVYDHGRSVVVLFGGQSAGGGTGEASFFSDTWEWDGVAWTQRFPAVSPPGRYFAAAAYDPGRGAVVLFGGSDRGQTTLDETWEWDGDEWTMFPAEGAPSPRADTYLVFDSVRGACMLFGGDDGSLPSDTWERRGTEWHELTPVAPPPGRRGTTLAFDGLRGVAVLFGGSHDDPPGSLFADTWEWDGTAWAQRTPSTAPPARSAGAMTFDPGRGVTVIFGGNGASGPLGDTWEWDGTDWTPS
jgi:hypothetical protein